MLNSRIESSGSCVVPQIRCAVPPRETAALCGQNILRQNHLTTVGFQQTVKLLKNFLLHNAAGSVNGAEKDGH